MIVLRRVGILASVCGVFMGVGTSQATSVGLNTDPAGPGWDRSDASTAFAVWDTYPSFTFNADTPDSSGGFASSALSQATTLVGTVGADQGAGVYSDIATQAVGDDIFYGGGRGGSWTLAGTTSFIVNEAILQIKRSASTTDFIGAISPTLNGIASDSVSSTSGTDDTHSGGAYSVTTWRWGPSIAGQSITNLNVAFTSPTHRGLDGIVLDVAVPEPTSIALLGLVAAAATVRRCRRI
jgi:hypothetical protein